MRKMRYRLLCTATAAPNDYIELGTSSEALGYLGYMDMLGQFFKNDQNGLHPSRRGRSFAMRLRAAYGGSSRTPKNRSGVGCARGLGRSGNRPILVLATTGFSIAELATETHIVAASRPLDGYLFITPAVGLSEQRKERSATVKERCEKVAERVRPMISALFGAS
jgi:hypothetical protein